jgi:hypothetical protein
MAGTPKPPEEKERLLREVLQDIEYEVRGWAKMSDLGIRVTGVGIRRGEAGSTNILVFLAHDDVRGERVLEYPIADRRFQHGAPGVGPGCRNRRARAERPGHRSVTPEAGSVTKRRRVISPRDVSGCVDDA